VGEFDIKSRILIYPRHYDYTARVTNGMRGMSWKGGYGVAGIELFGIGRFGDAINEKGLRIGLFYMPGFAEYRKYDPALADHEIAPTDVSAFLLSTCTNIDEVLKALKTVEVAAITEEVLGFPAPMHMIASEPSGRQIVVEWIGGKPKVYECPLGVITNSPTYDWHMINLRNYIGIGLSPKPDIKMDGVKFAPLGVGSGFLGLPGDFTPPSRFIRAVVFTQTARKTPDGPETIYEAFRILDNFNIPLGPSADAAKLPQANHRSDTCWTIAYDMIRKTFYYHTQNDRRVQKVDLEKIDFDKLAKPMILPLDDGHQTVLDRTGEIAAGN